MASDKDKQRTQKRFTRSLKHMVSRDEEQRRKNESKRRQAEGTKNRPRRGWDEDDDTFEKIPRGPRDAPPRSGADPHDVPPDLPRATVAAVHHGRVVLDTGHSARLAPRLFLDPSFRLAVGDEVAYRENEGGMRVEACVPRRTVLARADPGHPERRLVLAANVDTAVLVAAVVDPLLRPGLIDRFLLALAGGGVAPVVCANKTDLLMDCAVLDDLFEPYRAMDVPVFPCSATDGTGIEDLRAHLRGTTCVFVGHSGVGKSSLLNTLDPGGQRRTGAVRARDGKGRHTTSWSSLRDLGGGTRVIDTPGVRAFGLDRLEPGEVRAGFAEFGELASQCRFWDCSHTEEPECAVRRAVGGRVSAARYGSYRRILESLEP